MTDNEQTDHERQRRQAIRKAKTNRKQTRRKLLAHAKELAERRKENIEETADHEEQGVDSTNPTARSTKPKQDTNAEAAARSRHSTVPSEPRYSTVDAEERLYGLKLHRHLQDRGEDDE